MGGTNGTNVKSWGTMEGPILSDLNGELDTPILMCTFGEWKCKHFQIREHHHFFCMEQNGLQLQSCSANKNCKFAVHHVVAVRHSATKIEEIQ